MITHRSGLMKYIPGLHPSGAALRSKSVPDGFVTKGFQNKRNNRVHSRPGKTVCGFKDQTRAGPSGDKCGPEVLLQIESEFAAAVSGHPGNREHLFLHKIKTGSKIAPQLALEIYRNNTQGARINALELIYPACARILGKSVFRSIAQEFVALDSYGSADLNSYGKTFNQHLQRLLAAGRLPNDYSYLDDLAKLELMFHSAYYADDDPVFDFDDFERAVHCGLDMDFLPSQALGLIASNYPIHQVWTANGSRPGSERVSAINGAQYLVVHRHENRPEVALIDRDLYRILAFVTKSRTLHQMLDDTECGIDRVLPVLIARKWIVGINKHD